MKGKRGITLIALVITIIVLIILALIGMRVIFGENGLVDRAKQAKFYQIISSLEEDAKIKAYNMYFDRKELPEVIPNYGELTEEEKDEIVKNVPTLNDSIYQATGETVYDRDMYWLNKEDILKDDKEYLIDMDTLQVYDYVGETFLGRRWHTLNIGVEIGDGEGGSGGDSGEGEVPDGYMRIHLTYPEDSTDRQWRIGRPGESRQDGDLIWQDYTGDPILVKIDDIKNIWIRYNLKGVEVVEAPEGTLAVDIRVNPTEPNQEKVEVSVYFEEGSTNQKIKVGNGGWRVYTGPFEVTENCTIEAMAEKEMTITDSDGNNLGTTTVKGKDSYKITNIGEAEENQSLPAPTIEDIGNQGGSEKTTARVNYPEDQGNITKVYKINSGVEQTYTEDIKIEEWGTEVIAYYYNEAGEKSPEARKTFNDPTNLSVEIIVQPNPALDETIKETTVEIEYSEEAEQKTYKIDDGPEQTYTEPITITQNCTITAYARKTGVQEAIDSVTIEFREQEEESLRAPSFRQTDNGDGTATVEITYDANATIKQYNINGEELQTYTGAIAGLKDGDVIYAYCEDSTGNSADGTYTVDIQEDSLRAPSFRQTDNGNGTATVEITYDASATLKQYNVNGEGLQTYTGAIAGLKDGDVIYAYCENSAGNSADGTYTVDIQEEPEEEMEAPRFNQTDNEDGTATVEITYDATATIKQYNVNGGDLQNYTGAITNLKNNDVIYAYSANDKGQTADGTFTVKVEQIIEEIDAPIISMDYIEDKSKGRIYITYDANATVKQYSIDGGKLQDYTGPFEVTENGTVIYAINENASGASKDATYEVDGLIKKLDVKITVNPDTEETQQKGQVSIEYDEDATEKVYSINGGESKTYTGPFDITENSTIIAEAKAEDAYGKDTKQITNLENGLAAPVITESKTEETEGEVANISITYDKNSISNTYSIGTGAMQNYTGSFQVRENDTVIYAYSVDKFGNTATAEYVVDDLIRYLLIDKEKYYWIKLPYPEQSINREYKYKSDGIWKNYKEDGFILVKSEYEDELIQGGKPIRLEVEPGRYVDFDGHWYILDSDPQKLQEDIYMRWDDPENTTTPRVPLQILVMPAPPEKSDVVNVFIIYPSTAISKQYKIDDGAYQNYTGQLGITKNNTKITARTQYSDGSWSEEISYTVTNVDEDIAPEGIVDIKAEPTQPTKGNVTVTITYNPNSVVLKKKYKIGTGAWQYTEDNEVKLTIQENTTIYAALENNKGESSDAVTYNVENIDREGPNITNFTTTNITDSQITVQVTANDSGSGLATSGTYKYYLNGSLKETSTTSSYTYTELTDDTQYTLKVEVADKLGNVSNSETTARTEKKKSDIENAKDNQNIYEETTSLKDDFDNEVVIPGGFHIAEDSGTKVEEGIVIEDDAGNQFVWIPVGEYNVSTSINAEGKLTNNLSRRTFTSSEATEVSGDAAINNSYYGEGNSRSVARNQIQRFKTSANNNGGYYIGRYEAGTEERRTSSSEPLTIPLVQENKNPYDFITRDQAKTQSEAMYSGNSYVTSELISSYAWDTALNFICQTNEEGYLLATTTDKNYGNINGGRELTGAYEADNYSNIHDLLGNYFEWTTEYCSSSSNPCIYRGGTYLITLFNASSRTVSGTNDFSRSFRIQLYIK